jgi:hypothetical protein
VDISHITKKINLLEGICPEAVELFKDRQFSVELGRVIRVLPASLHELTLHSR